jgi:hypothetical protein
MHFTIILGSIVILVFGVFGITPALPVLVHFLLIETHPDITAHLIKHCKEENPETPVQYL